MINQFPDAIMERFRIVVSNDLTALIRLRIQSTGTNADGGSFKEYAEITKQIRQSRGMQTNFKDFTFTGEMWRKFGEKSFSKGSQKLSVTIGGKSQSAEKKINDNTEREGISIIAPSDDELKKTEEILIDEIDKYISSIGV